MAQYSENNSGLIPNSVLFNKRGNKKMRCPLTNSDAGAVDYKNIRLLKEYISEKGRILPSRITGVKPPMQRKLKLAIKRARALALLPYVDNR